MFHFSGESSAGFSLVDTMVGTFVLGLVIAGGLTGLGQASMLSEKSREQAEADFILRSEVEQIRSMTWAEVSALVDQIEDFRKSNGGRDFDELQTVSATRLTDMRMSAAVKADTLSNAGESGKAIFHITLSWKPISGRSSTEARAFIVTEGGLSANE